MGFLAIPVYIDVLRHYEKYEKEQASLQGRAEGAHQRFKVFSCNKIPESYDETDPFYERLIIVRQKES
jgi:hypothetical protein